mgnify:CR=1 FL=1
MIGYNILIPIISKVHLVIYMENSKISRSNTKSHFSYFYKKSGFLNTVQKIICLLQPHPQWLYLAALLGLVPQEVWTLYYYR